MRNDEQSQLSERPARTIADWGLPMADLWRQVRLALEQK
jgi:hypothetical protein